MTGRLLAELSWVASREVDAISQPYAWPPRGPLSDEERAEVAYLDALARRLSEAGEAAGCLAQGLDALYVEYVQR